MDRGWEFQAAFSAPPIVGILTTPPVLAHQPLPGLFWRASVWLGWQDSGGDSDLECAPSGVIPPPLDSLLRQGGESCQNAKEGRCPKSSLKFPSPDLAPCPETQTPDPKIPGEQAACVL